MAVVGGGEGRKLARPCEPCQSEGPLIRLSRGRQSALGWSCTGY